MKIPFRKLILSVPLAILCLLYVLMTTAGQTQPGQSPDAFAVRTATALWDHYFQEHVKKGDDVVKVQALIASKALDWGRLNLGGTGNYALRFKLDDFMQAEFQFDQANKMQSYGVFRHRELWIKDPDGNILYQSEK